MCTCYCCVEAWSLTACKLVCMGLASVAAEMNLSLSSASVSSLTNGAAEAKQSPTPGRAKLGFPSFKRLFSSTSHQRKTSTCSIESVSEGKDKKQLKCASMHNLHNTHDKDTTVSIKSYLLKSPRWGRSACQITGSPKPQKGVVINVNTQTKQSTVNSSKSKMNNSKLYLAKDSPKIDTKVNEHVTSQVKFQLGTPEGQRRCTYVKEGRKQCTNVKDFQCNNSHIGVGSGRIITIPLPLLAYTPAASEQSVECVSHDSPLTAPLTATPTLRLGTSSPNLLTSVHSEQVSNHRMTKTSTMDCIVGSPLSGAPDMGMSRSIHSYNEALSNASFQSFFTRKVKTNLKRTKSVNKLDRRKVNTAGAATNGTVDG